MIDPHLSLADFDYHLPPELIAQKPAEQRNQSRLLCLKPDGSLADHLFTELPQFLRPHDVLVFNNTRVIKARLMGHKASGGKIEGLVERITEPKRALMHIKSSKSPKPESELLFAENAKAKVLGRQDDLFEVLFEEDVLEILERFGTTPLPPYIEHSASAEDEQRYQTVYAEPAGAVAAPTAGLHFDQTMLAHLDTMGVQTAFVTLHVGAGTFQPVRAQRIQDHIMHAEWYEVSEATSQAIVTCRQHGGRVWAIGTTSVRALESAAAQGGTLGKQRVPCAHCDDTRLFITPGYQFNVVDGLLTNFHLPQSTLLMLVSALVGVERLQQTYAHAITQGYRFFSFGDAMLIEPNF